MARIIEDDDIPDSPASASRLQDIGHDITPISPTHSSSVKECPVCRKELSWFTRKRKCDICRNVTCKQCCSKKTIPGTVACRDCLEKRNLRREPTDESNTSPGASPKADVPTDPLVADSSGPSLIPKGYFGYLKVRLMEGRGLIAADTNILGQRTTSDPYCVVTLSRDRTRRSTRVISSTLNPVWNEILEMPVRFPVQLIEIDIFDKDVAGSDDFIGKIVIPLERLPNGKPMSGWVPITYTKENEDPGTEMSYGDPGTNAAGAINLSVRLDYKIRSELRGYIRGAVAEPPPRKVKFDINALYGPGMLAVELLWTRMLSPFVSTVLYVLLWENFVVSTIALGLWIPAAMKFEYWPSAFFFSIDCLMTFNFIKRSFRALANPLEVSQESTKSLKKKMAKLPGIKQAGAIGKNIGEKAGILSRSGSKSLNDGGASGAAKSSPVAQPTAAGEDDLPPDYEEQSLGSVVGKLMLVSPGWLKEMLAGFQPTARSLADLATMIYDIFQGNHDLSLIVFFTCLIFGVGLLYFPFRYFVAGLGLLVLFATSPLMRILLGAIAYLQRAKRFNDPALLGLGKNFETEWMSQDAINHSKKRKPGRGQTVMDLTSD
jgi:hypothetical protein